MYKYNPKRVAGRKWNNVPFEAIWRTFIEIEAIEKAGAHSRRKVTPC